MMISFILKRSPEYQKHVSPKFGCAFNKGRFNNSTILYAQAVGHYLATYT